MWTQMVQLNRAQTLEKLKVFMFFPQYIAILDTFENPVKSFCIKNEFFLDEDCHTYQVVTEFGEYL